MLRRLFSGWDGSRSALGSGRRRLFVHGALQVILHIAGGFLELFDAAAKTTSQLGDLLRTEEHQDNNQDSNNFRPT